MTVSMPAPQGAGSVHVQLRALCNSLRVCGAPIPPPPERRLHAHHLLDDWLRGQRRQVLLLLAGVPDGPHPQHLPGAAAGHGHPQPAGGPAPGFRWAPSFLLLLFLPSLCKCSVSVHHPQPAGGPAPGLRWAFVALPPFLEHVLSLHVLLLLECPLGSANNPQPAGGSAPGFRWAPCFLLLLFLPSSHILFLLILLLPSVALSPFLGFVLCLFLFYFFLNACLGQPITPS